jgi:hypothetical protein
LKPIPEKTEEILFNRFFLQGFRLGEVTMYAPSTVEEARNGYDSMFTGLSIFREIYLQFKAPTYSESRGHFTIHTTRHQHRMLKQYPPHTAYYLTHTFSSLEECTEAQRNVRIAVDFLKHFIAIEIAFLPNDVDFFHYYKPHSHRESPQIAYKRTSDGVTRKAEHEVIGDGWLRGNQLVEKFKDDHIGALVLLTADGEKESSGQRGRVAFTAAEDILDAPHRFWRLSPREVDYLLSDRTDTSFGIHVRKFIPDDRETHTHV